MARSKARVALRKLAAKTAVRLKAKYIKLLDQRRPEQVYQDFIEKNTRLVPREFIQNHGVHFDLVLRKLSIGADYRSDFVYLSKSSADWNCILVEIERPDSRFFKDGSNDFHRDFSKALQQINRWRAWLHNQANKANLVDSVLAPIRRPLERNFTHIKFVLVFGRRSEFDGNELRTNLIVAQERDDFKVLSFDSLAESLHTKSDLYLGARKNEYVDILSDKFLAENMFAWMKPEQIRVSTRFVDDAKAHRDSWFHHETVNGKDALVMGRALERVRKRSDAPSKKAKSTKPVRSSAWRRRSSSMARRL